MAWEVGTGRPLTRAWIETDAKAKAAAEREGRPLTRAWIETCITVMRQFNRQGSPAHAGVD